MKYVLKAMLRCRHKMSKRLSGAAIRVGAVCVHKKSCVFISDSAAPVICRRRLELSLCDGFAAVVESDVKKSAVTAPTITAVTPRSTQLTPTPQLKV